jgi:hypothetical protein
MGERWRRGCDWEPLSIRGEGSQGRVASVGHTAGRTIDRCEALVVSLQEASGSAWVRFRCRPYQRITECYLSLRCAV